MLSQTQMIWNNCIRNYGRKYQQRRDKNLATKIVVPFQSASHETVSSHKTTWVRIKGNAEGTGTKYYLSKIHFDTTFKLEWSNERCNTAHLTWRLEKCCKISLIILK